MPKIILYQCAILVALTSLSIAPSPNHNSEGGVIMESLAPNVMVEDVNRTVEYYKAHFGFKLTDSVPETGSFDWAMVTHGNVNLMFQSKESLWNEFPPLKGQQPGGSLSFFIQVKDVDGLYQSVSSKVEVVDELETKFYGMREFTIRDLNGYFLTFAEQVE